MRRGVILLVDPHAPSRAGLRRLLVSSGHRVLEAANGAGAVAVVAGSPEPIDVVITADTGPDWLDGRLLSGPAPPRGVIVTSALEPLDEGLRRLPTTCASFNFCKPLDFDQIERVLAELLEAS